jgi:hypothetical protein
MLMGFAALKPSYALTDLDIALASQARHDFSRFA